MGGYYGRLLGDYGRLLWAVTGRLQACTSLHKLVQACTSLHKLVQACSTNLYKLVQACTSLYKPVQACTSLSKLVQIGKSKSEIGANRNRIAETTNRIETIESKSVLPKSDPRKSNSIHNGTQGDKQLVKNTKTKTKGTNQSKKEYQMVSMNM